MPYYSDNLDDLIAFDATRTFDGGQVSALQSDLLAENQVQQLNNMILSPAGSLETRRGIKSFCTATTSQEGSLGGFRYYDTPDYERLVTVTQGRLYTIDSNGNAELHANDDIWNNLTGATRTWNNENQLWADGFYTAYDQKVSMAQFNNKMYMADADGALYYYDGVIGTRQGGKLRAITITSGGTGYTSATAIVTGPDWGGQLPTLITTVAGGVVTGVTVVDGGSGYPTAPTVTFVGDGNGATATATVSPPPQNLRLLINTGNRLFAVGSANERNTLYCSDILDASVWDAQNSIVVNADDGDEITAIVPYYQNRIIVFKKRRIFQVTIPPDMVSAADWTVQLISNNVGCIAEASAVQVNSDIFFLGDDGIRSLVRSMADDFTSIGLPLSEPVKDVIQEINIAKINICQGAFYDNRYYLAYPTGANDFNDSVLVYNTILKCFEGRWSWKAMGFAIANFQDQGLRLMLKSTTGEVTTYGGYKAPSATTATDYIDYGVYTVSTGTTTTTSTGTYNYESIVRTRDYKFGDPFAYKHGSYFEIIFGDSFSTDTNISIQRDVDIGDIEVQPNLNISSAVLTLPFTLPATLPTSLKKRVASDLRSYDKWRLLNIKIRSSANKMSLRQITAAANPDTIQLEKSL